MVKFYFGKFRITVFFVVFVLASIFSTIAVVKLSMDGLLVLPEILMFPITILGAISYWRYIKAVYNNEPALIIDQDSIYIFDINQTLYWKDVESYKFGRYLGRIISINLKLADPKGFISLINNAIIKFLYQLRYFLFKRIIIRVQVNLLKDYPESIVEAIDAVTNNSQIIEPEN